jgi:hypothetical protein
MICRESFHNPEGWGGALGIGDWRSEEARIVLKFKWALCRAGSPAAAGAARTSVDREQPAVQASGEAAGIAATEEPSK